MWKVFWENPELNDPNTGGILLPNDVQTETNADEEVVPNVWRSQRVIKPPKRFCEDCLVCSYEMRECEIPKNAIEARESAQSEEWIAAMDEEINSLVANDVWELIERPKS